MSEEQTQDTQQQEQDFAVAEENKVESSIPEYVPEKFWDKDKNELNVEELGMSYKALEKKLGQRTDVLYKELEEDYANKMSAKAPEEYVIPELELPEGVNVDINTEEPMLQWWADTARKAGLSQEQFAEGIEQFVNNEIAGLPDIQAEKELLGDNADQRIESANLWAKKNLTPDSYDAISQFAARADGVKVIEELMNLTKEAPIPQHETQIDVKPSLADIRSMMNDPRYYEDGRKDPAYIEKVTQLFNKYAT
jgi:hypothetical protein